VKVIHAPGENKVIGVRLTGAQEGASCVPAISGLFLRNRDMSTWDATEISANDFLYNGQAAFIPIQLMGMNCGLDVIWRTAWAYTGGSGTEPVFHGFGALGVVGFTISDTNSEERFLLNLKGGVLQVWATAGGKEYGPVTIAFTGGNY